MKIKLTVSGRVSTGRLVSFVAPCGSDRAECLTIGGKEYMICNAIGTNAAGTNAWVTGAIVSVILNVEDAKAYIQNADPKPIISQTDIVAGSTALATGQSYHVYE